MDGSDSATESTLAQINDARLKVICHPTSLGAAAARNTGVKAAGGFWVAFLDDDDQWQPQKLALQWELAQRSSHQFPIISCRLIVQDTGGSVIWPRRFPDQDEAISDYLFVRHEVFQGEGFIQTSTLLIKKALLDTFSFNEQLPIHEDWDWLIRVSHEEGVGIEFVADPLVIMYVERERDRLSRSQDWQFSFHWIRSIRHLVTPQAYSSFLLTFVSDRASLEGSWQAFFPLLKEAIQFGQPRPIDYTIYLAMWLLPQKRRVQIRAMITNSNH